MSNYRNHAVPVRRSVERKSLSRTLMNAKSGVSSSDSSIDVDIDIDWVPVSFAAEMFSLIVLVFRKKIDDHVSLSLVMVHR